jgi:creatinine amidohydrolase
MKNPFLLITTITLLTTLAYGQAPASNVDFTLMTWPELRAAIQIGKTTALVFNGGTEQRGPQGVTGAHSFVAHEVGLAIAQKLGNAILAPVLPYSVNRASAVLPGTIGINGQLFAEINEQVAEQPITNGFKNVVLMGDHGGGQKELSEVAQTLSAKYASQGVHVVYCDAVYVKADRDFNKWVVENHLPAGEHAAIKDTSELLYLEGDRPWIRKELIATAVGDPIRAHGMPRDPNEQRVGNGITGDARPSNPEIGKRIVELKINYAVEQIQQLLRENTGATAQGQ